MSDFKYCMNCGLSHYVFENGETKLYCRYKKQYMPFYDVCGGYQKEGR